MVYNINFNSNTPIFIQTFPEKSAVITFCALAALALVVAGSLSVNNIIPDVKVTASWGMIFGGVVLGVCLLIYVRRKCSQFKHHPVYLHWLIRNIHRGDLDAQIQAQALVTYPLDAVVNGQTAAQRLYQQKKLSLFKHLIDYGAKLPAGLVQGEHGIYPEDEDGLKQALAADDPQAIETILRSLDRNDGIVGTVAANPDFFSIAVASQNAALRGVIKRLMDHNAYAREKIKSTIAIQGAEPGIRFIIESERLSSKEGIELIIQRLESRHHLPSRERDALLQYLNVLCQACDELNCDLIIQYISQRIASPVLSILLDHAGPLAPRANDLMAAAIISMKKENVRLLEARGIPFYPMHLVESVFGESRGEYAGLYPEDNPLVGIVPKDVYHSFREEIAPAWAQFVQNIKVTKDALIAGFDDQHPFQIVPQVLRAIIADYYFTVALTSQ